MKKIILSSMTMLLLFTSCENYLDVNEDQSNSAYYQDIAPKQMLAGAISAYTTHQTTTLATFGNRLTYVWGLNSGFTSSDPAYTYVFDSGSYIANFENTYLFADNFQDIIDKKDKYPNYEYHLGVAKIFKVMCMDYITALYGDVPYSEAFNDNITAPKYDDDKLIIAGLFKELDEAKAYLNTTNPAVNPLNKEDIVFGGDITKWKQFLNTVELRLLMRLTKTTDPTLVALRTARFNAMNASQDFITTDVAVNPGYFNGTQSQRSPVYRVYGRNEALSDWTSQNRSNAAGDYIIRLVTGQVNDANISSTGVNDPRRLRMFANIPLPAAGDTPLPGAGTLRGNIQGVFPLTEISRFASFYTGRTGASTAAADKNGMERNAFLMLAAEGYFLQAEAIQRGYLTGSAKAAFDAGVTASFNFYSTSFGSVAIAPLNPTAYLASIAGKNGLDYTVSTDKINAIITQKYLALAEWSGMELFIDQLRTGFPNTPLPVGVNGTTRPNRLIYPSSEYSANSANVPNVTNAEIFTVNAKTPYYLQ
jgi:hypothetical protein